MSPDQRDAGKIVEREQLGAQAVVDVMGVIGDVVGDRGDLRLRAGKAPQLESCLAMKSRMACGTPCSR